MKPLKLSSLFDIAWKKGTVKYDHTLSYLEKIRDKCGGYYGLIGKAKACWKILFSNFVVVDFDLDNLREDLEDFKAFREKEREKIKSGFDKRIDRLESQLASSQEKRNELQSKVWELQEERDNLKKSIEIVSQPNKKKDE